MTLEYRTENLFKKSSSSSSLQWSFCHLPTYTAPAQIQPLRVSQQASIPLLFTLLPPIHAQFAQSFNLKATGVLQLCFGLKQIVDVRPYQ